MRTEIKGIHLDVTANVKDYIEKRLHKIDFAQDMIIDLVLTLTKEKRSFKIEANIHFRWGASAHLSADSYDVFEAIDSLAEKLENKVIREKEKIQEHNT